IKSIADYIRSTWMLGYRWSLSVITNMAAGVLERPLSAGEVDEAAEKAAGAFSEYMKKIIAAI
ncbi:MAG: hypothetical protein K2L38_02360, partial [Dysosmobacter sp.]|nr:hypothetical protein [Dysosmobacter sp.]